MSHPRLRHEILAGLLVGLCVGPAQLRPAAEPIHGSRGQSPQDSPPSQPVFRAGTTLVQIDAIVRQPDGTFAEDLTLEDFEVLDDGKPQKVDVLYLVVGKQPRAVPLAAGPAPSRARAAQLPPPVQRVFVLVFDLQHIRPGRFLRARAAAEAFLQTELRDGDLAGIVSGGRLVNGRLTTRREELLAAVRGVTFAPDAESFQLELNEWPRMNEFEAYQVVAERGAPSEPVTDAVVAAACAERPDACDPSGEVRLLVDGKAMRIVSRAGAAVRSTLGSLSALCQGLARLPGRKTVVLFSDGFIVDKELKALNEVVGRAARADAVIYTLDTRGLDRGTASGDILSQAAPTAGGTASLMKQMSVNALQDGMDSLAVDTGGLAIRNANDFPTALHEVAEDGRAYYVLGYRPATASREGQFHKVTVRVRRPGLTVRARQGYLAPPSPPVGADRGGPP